MNQVQARPLAERRKAALECLRSNSNLWLATASDGRGPHLIPLSYWSAGSRLTTATSEGSRTVKNVRAQRVRGDGPEVTSEKRYEEIVKVRDGVAAGHGRHGAILALHKGTVLSSGFWRRLTRLGRYPDALRC